MIDNCVPEPPPDNKEDNIHMQEVIFGSDEDDTENEPDNVYNDYQLLNSFADLNDSSSEESDDENIECANTNSEESSCDKDETTKLKPLLKDREEKLSKLFPTSRDISINCEQVRSAMAGFKLPTSAIPPWALNIPDAELDTIIINRICPNIKDD